MQKASAPPEDCVVTDCAVWSGSSSRRYPPDLRERAARMVAASSDQHESGVGGDRRGCPAVASCWHPQGPSPADSHHQYESINRTDPSTVVGYRALLDRHINPTLGAVPLGHLSGPRRAELRDDD